MAQIGLTGASGFVGGHLGPALVRTGHDVHVLDPCTRGESGFEAVPGELDWIVHLAARTGIARGQDAPFTVVRDNLESTRRMCRLALRSGADVLYVSSYVYGPARYNPVDELHPVAPSNPYMLSKRVGEVLCANLLQGHDTRLAVMRPFSIYGPNMPAGRLLGDLLAQVATGGPLTVLDPDPVRDHMHIEDLISLIQSIVDKRLAANCCINAGTGLGVSNLEVARTLRKLLPGAMPIRIEKPARPNPIGTCIADISTASRTMAWQPRFDLTAGLERCLASMHS